MAKGVKTGGGSRKGIPNKVTADARETFRRLLEDNGPKMQRWVERVARKNPAMALRLLADLAEFIVPKLSRAELANDGTGKLVIEFRHTGAPNGEAH